jgi:hypothetical protein
VRRAALTATLLLACTREVVVHRAAPCPTDVSTDADAAPPDAASDAPATPLPPEPTPPAPMVAGGKFSDQSDMLGKPLKLDPGNKSSKKEPAANIGLLIDLDKDDLVDAVLTDGMSEVRWGRAVQPLKWLWLPMIDVKSEGVHCLAATDGDGDGYPEVIVGSKRLRYLVRQKDETYADRAEERGLDGATVGVQSVAPVDLDNDGALDLVVAEFSCDGKSKLRGFLNLGDGRYEERTKAWGLGQAGSFWFVMATDVDGDGWVDLLAGTEGCPPVGANVYLRNRGTEQAPQVAPQPRFEPLPLGPLFLSTSLGGGTPMGGSVGDVDSDGDLDYVFSEIGYREQERGGMNLAEPNRALLALDVASANHLLVRRPDGGFDSGGLKAGIALPLSQTQRSMVSWAARLFDVDADGRLDLWLTHGYDMTAYLLADDGGARPVLYRNQGNGTFTEASATFGLPDLHVARALAAADLDADGDLDFLAGGQTMQPKLWRNDVTYPGRSLTVRLRGKASNPWGLGARLTLLTDQRSFVAEVSTQAPSHTIDQPVAQFGIPADQKAQTLQIDWPSGYRQVVPVGAAKQLVVDEPPLVQLSARTSVGFVPVTVTARSYGVGGQPDGGKVTVELVAGAGGSWAGPLQCKDGLCQRTFLPPPGQGESAIEVSLGGKALRVRPTVRYGF